MNDLHNFISLHIRVSVNILTRSAKAAAGWCIGLGPLRCSILCSAHPWMEAFLHCTEGYHIFFAKRFCRFQLCWFVIRSRVECQSSKNRSPSPFHFWQQNQKWLVMFLNQCLSSGNFLANFVCFFFIDLANCQMSYSCSTPLKSSRIILPIPAWRSVTALLISSCCWPLSFRSVSLHACFSISPVYCLFWTTWKSTTYPLSSSKRFCCAIWKDYELITEPSYRFRHTWD